MAEWVIVAAALVVLSSVALLVRGMVLREGRDRWWWAAGWIRFGVEVVLAVLLVFYLVWGSCYARVSLEERLGWSTEPVEPDVLELEFLSRAFTHAANDAYMELHGTADVGRPTFEEPWKRSVDALPVGFDRLTTELGLEEGARWERPAPKRLLLSRITTLLGIGGFYFPFTGEANINADIPGWQVPHTISHELAHQRGIAPENEANFIGVLAALSSDDPLVRYSGALFQSRQLLRTLLKVDEARAVVILYERHPGVQRDVDDSRAFWVGVDGPAVEMSHAINHAYLTVNQVEAGIKSYSRSLQMLVRWHRHTGRVTEPVDRP